MYSLFSIMKISYKYHNSFLWISFECHRIAYPIIFLGWHILFWVSNLVLCPYSILVTMPWGWTISLFFFFCLKLSFCTCACLYMLEISLFHQTVCFKLWDFFDDIYNIVKLLKLTSNEFRPKPPHSVGHIAGCPCIFCTADQILFGAIM